MAWTVYFKAIIGLRCGIKKLVKNGYTVLEKPEKYFILKFYFDFLFLIDIQGSDKNLFQYFSPTIVGSISTLSGLARPSMRVGIAAGETPLRTMGSLSSMRSTEPGVRENCTEF